MKTIAQFVRTTIIGGLFFLAPIVVLIVILAKAFDFAKKGLNAVLVHFPAALELSPAPRLCCRSRFSRSCAFLPGSSPTR